VSAEEKMNIDEKRKYLRQMQRRYKKAGRKERGRLLDEMQAVTELNRNYLIELMQGDLKRKPRGRQRGYTYGPEVDDAIRVIWESLDHICAERLKPALAGMAQHLHAHGEMVVYPELVQQLDKISISTVRRRLDRMQQDQPRLPRGRGVKRGRKLTQAIPMRRIPWYEQEPGHFETDLVHHCGATASGEYVCTLQMIDVLTGWSERRAVLGRSYLVVEDNFRVILARLPFPVQEIHPDNGSEFINHHMLRFWGEIVQGVRLSRSRPYHKNDNRFVEQKNSPLVRAYLGYERLDTIAQTIAANHLYDQMWLYYNFFQPVQRLIDKTVIPGADGHLRRIKRRHDKARTPFERLCDTGAMLPEHQQQLQVLRDQTNPRQLRQEIYDLIDYIFSLPNAIPGITEDVFQTLTFYQRSQQCPTQDVDIFPFSFNRTLLKEDET